jgi:DNA-binding FadR family transcriptional regulator
LQDAAGPTAEQQAYLRRVNLEHESIFNAIVTQDAEAARAAMRTHLSNSRDRLKRGEHTEG